MTDPSTMLVTALVPALALSLLHFLWQGALVGLLAWLGLSLLRNARPQARYAVACIALLACAALPVIDLVLALRGSGLVIAPLTSHPAAAPFEAAPAGGMFNAGVFDAGMLAAASGQGFAWIVALWAAGAGLLSVRMTLGVLWVRRLCGDSISDASQQWQASAMHLTKKFGIRRAISLRIVEAGESPITAGWWRPVILLPAAVVARMPADLLEALLAHELAHIRRHDYLVNLLQSAVEAMLFYHPVVWWLSHRIRIERELVADDLAAEVLGERRRLAIALSELDRIAGTRSPFPNPQFAQAAHGGHLMSRIQQLLRPQRRSIGTTLALPVLGLFAAGIAFYAHASYQPQPVSTLSPSAAVPSPAPVRSPAPLAAPLPAPRAVAGPVIKSPEPVPARDSVVMHGGARDSSYALVRKGRQGIAMSGSTDDIDEIRLTRGSIEGDFIWLRRDGKAYVIRDAALLARVEKAWLATDALNVQMGVLNERMQPHQRKMEALQARMEKRQDALERPTVFAASQQEMEALSRQMESLSKRQHALAMQMSSGDDARRDELHRKMDALQQEQDALSRRMDEHARVIDAEAREIERMHAPMEAIGREMELAARPMEAIGKDMEVLGKQIEREAKVADREVRIAIEEALQAGLAVPAPGRH